MTIPKSTAAHIAALEAAVQEAKAEAAEAKAEAAGAKRIAGETHDMVEAIHNKLMNPQPGQKRGLLDRMASVTIDIESGKRTGQIIVALVGFAMMIAALLKWGHVPKG